MSNYKRKEVMDYLTRKPTTVQDIELARTRIQTPVPSQQMPVASGEELGTREGFRDGTKIYKTTVKNPLTTEQQNKIKEIFPEADFSKGRYGFSYDDKKNYMKVFDFVERKNFQPSLTPYYLQEGKVKEPLPKSTQDKIKQIFGSEHKGEFNFDIYQYGVTSGNKGDRNLAARIKAYVTQPIGQERTEKNIGFNLRQPENKLLNY